VEIAMMLLQEGDGVVVVGGGGREWLLGRRHCRLIGDKAGKASVKASRARKARESSWGWTRTIF
jgi:hypothetical protein